MYNCLGEICVLILSAVLLFNTVNSVSLKERKHVYFLLCMISVMASTSANVLSIYFIEHFNPDRIFLSGVVTSIYFLLLGLVPLFFSIYCYEFLSTEKKHKKIFYTSIAVPTLIYFVVLALNPFFSFIFRYDVEAGYTRGSLKNITYVVTLTHSIILLIAVFAHRKMLSQRTKIVFIIYPFLGLAISLIQFFSTHLVMTGTSSFATILLVYLSIQSDLLEYDIQTGLLTEKQLVHSLLKKPEGILTVISIENYSALEVSLSVYSLNRLILMISSRLSSMFARSAFHISENKFAVLSENFEVLQKNIADFFNEFEQITTEANTNHHVDFIAATVELPKNAENYERAMLIINDLLLRARTKKGQKFICCDETYLSDSKRSREIYKILDRELHASSEQFQVYFQPIYSVVEKRFVYAEALSRLRNTELGDISPAEFIAIAENKGLIERLGNVVFEKVCDFISRNKDTVKAVSVNFSVYQMMSPNIVDFVLDTIKKYGIKPENIIMEITESIFIKDFEPIRERMVALSNAGICFYLDDFGTGYSNFANVITLPFRTIKIDRSFVLMMETNEDLACLIKGLIHTFKENGLKILFEGVETKSQDEMIRKAETDYIQGFLYSRPITGEEFLSVMAQ